MTARFVIRAVQAMGFFFLFIFPKKEGLWIFTVVKTEERGDNKVQCKTHISQINHDSTVIITSSLIPTHPSRTMLNSTHNSLKMLHGLQNSTPVFVTVDGLDPAKNDNEENKKRPQECTQNTRLAFKNDHRVKVLTSYTFGHLTNSLKMAIDMVDTEYVYVVQHDFPFVKPINHTAIVESMRKIPELHIVLPQHLGPPNLHQNDN